MLLMLGSVVVLREPLRRIQVSGVATLLLGFGLFFNERLADLLRFREGYGLGLALGLTAAVVWAVYGVTQKILLREMAPPRIMRALYTVCALALTPFAAPQSLLRLDALQIVCLAYCCLNTLVAYGAFSRAMACWHTAKVSAVITLTPLFTLVFAKLFHLLGPAFSGRPIELAELTAARWWWSAGPGSLPWARCCIPWPCFTTAEPHDKMHRARRSSRAMIRAPCLRQARQAARVMRMLPRMFSRRARRTSDRQISSPELKDRGNVKRVIGCRCGSGNPWRRACCSRSWPGSRDTEHTGY